MRSIPVTEAAVQSRPNAAAIELISILGEAGYTVREKCHGTHPRWTCSHSENGVSAEFYQTPYAPGPTVDSEVQFKHIKFRNSIGNYLMWGHGYYRVYKDGRSSLQLCKTGLQTESYNKNEAKSALLALVGEKGDKKWTSLDNLPPPIPFAERYEIVEDSDTAKKYALNKADEEVPVFIQNIFFLSCRCVRPASIDKKLKVTDDYHAPGAAIWFIINGLAINARGERTRAAILVNEQVDGFYPLVTMKNGGYRLSDNFTPNNAKTDFTRLSHSDKELILAAVGYYLSNLVKK